MSATTYLDQFVKESNLPIQEIANKSYMKTNTLYKLRSGERQLTANHALNIAKALDDYSITQEHCCSSCDIGKNFQLVRLNGNIRDQGHEILWKSKTEIKEFLEVLPQMIEILFDTDSYTIEEKRAIDKGFHEALDVEHCIKTLRGWYSKRFGIEELEHRIKEHNDKCFDKGFAVKKGR